MGPVAWDEPLIRKAVIWLARKLDKPILKLTDEDYNEAGLQDLLADHGPAYDINLEVFRALQETITGWPGGKPDAKKRPGDIRRATDTIFPKRVLIFSPHPDDDVISMGGTLIRLVDQGHEVHVAYQTSGQHRRLRPRRHPLRRFRRRLQPPLRPRRRNRPTRSNGTSRSSSSTRSRARSTAPRCSRSRR